nr:GGDEF domain-containing protein [Vibrio sp. Of7-15]
MAVNYYRKNRINQQRSLTDPLTGIGNRLSFDQDLQSLVEQYRLGDNAFSLFYIDLDNFKSVNDNLSHDDGDRLLINITTELTQILRSVDHLYRIGGDEFILLAPQNHRLGRW